MYRNTGQIDCATAPKWVDGGAKAPQMTVLTTLDRLLKWRV